MSRKAECPGCGSYTSAIQAVLDGDSAGWGEDECPSCGLAVETMRAVLDARKRVADKDLQAKYEAAEIRAANAEKALRVAEQKLANIRAALCGDELAAIELDKANAIDRCRRLEFALEQSQKENAKLRREWNGLIRLGDGSIWGDQLANCGAPGRQCHDPATHPHFPS